MARRHRTKKASPSPPPSSPSPVKRAVDISHQMRGLIEAARAPRARRFVSPMKVQSQINATIKKELVHEIARKSKPIAAGSRSAVTVSGTPVSGRNALHKSPVLRKGLSKPVRDVLLDSERALECSRRETRRQVMFAMHRTGKNGRKNRKARWTADSRISCKGR